MKSRSSVSNGLQNYEVSIHGTGCLDRLKDGNQVARRGTDRIQGRGDITDTDPLLEDHQLTVFLGHTDLSLRGNNRFSLGKGGPAERHLRIH